MSQSTFSMSDLFTSDFYYCFPLLNCILEFKNVSIFFPYCNLENNFTTFTINI